VDNVSLGIVPPCLHFYFVAQNKGIQMATEHWKNWLASLNLEKNHWGKPLLRNDWVELDLIELAKTPFIMYSPELIKPAFYVDINGLTHSGMLHLYWNETLIFMSRAYDTASILRIRIWKSGCEHNNRTTKRLDNCWNQYTCEACGLVWDVDSSG
jgi:hypothetical protein